MSCDIDPTPEILSNLQLVTHPPLLPISFASPVNQSTQNKQACSKAPVILFQEQA